MRKRRSFNPKRRLCSEADFLARGDGLKDSAARARYSGNPEHKRNPRDFGLQPPTSPRLGKTLCDDVGILRKADAISLLKAGFTKGLVSVQEGGGWPQNVWAVTVDGQPLEAQLEGDGVYHGYPMPQADPFREDVLARWNQS